MKKTAIGHTINPSVSRIPDRISGKEILQITRGPGSHYHQYFNRPCATPDGKHLIVGSDRNGQPGKWETTDLFLLALADFTLVQITDYTQRESRGVPKEYSVACSADSRYLYYAVFRDLYRVDLHSLENVLITHFDDPIPYGVGGVTLTADGRYAIMGAGTGSNAPPSGGRGFRYDDGTQIIFQNWKINLSTGRKEVFYEVPYAQEELCHINASPRNPNLIYIGVHTNHLPAANDGCCARFIDLSGKVVGETEHGVHARGIRAVHPGFCYHADLFYYIFSTGTSWKLGEPARIKVLDLHTWKAREIISTRETRGTFGHCSPSLDGRFFAADHMAPLDPHGDFPQPPFPFLNEIYLIKVEDGSSRPLCAADSSWGITQNMPFTSGSRFNEHVPGKLLVLGGEALHPRPVFTPDGRYVVFDSDRFAGESQIFLFELKSE